MPHIHTESGQHDITASAWIVREDADEPRVLVHMHRKLGKLMQVGGHIEIDETPWQTLAHEIPEESGFMLRQLQILQPQPSIPTFAGATVHPLPVVSNTHMVSDTHYHSDYGYAFVVDGDPEGEPADGESQDLRWLTIGEMGSAAVNGLALQDVVDIYRYVVEVIVPNYHRINAVDYSLDKPKMSLLHTEKASAEEV